MSECFGQMGGFTRLVSDNSFRFREDWLWFVSSIHPDSERENFVVGMNNRRLPALSLAFVILINVTLSFGIAKGKKGAYDSFC